MTNAHIYRIKIREQLDESWSERLGNLSITPDLQTNGTIIAGAVPDQAALRGLLNQMFDFNLQLVGLEMVSAALSNQEV
ncbi:MAG: hypothetical protein JWP00_2587 [Chloroflexi bacterium]|jgi:hypothetical protein|nr:hypothetical protein [Chloroflexota bacterium]